MFDFPSALMNNVNSKKSSDAHISMFAECLQINIPVIYYACRYFFKKEDLSWHIRFLMIASVAAYVHPDAQ
jgi:hypothetical protein